MTSKKLSNIAFFCGSMVGSLQCAVGLALLKSTDPVSAFIVTMIISGVGYAAYNKLMEKHL